MEELVFDLSSDVEDVRKVAIVWLAQVGDATVVPHLRKLTEDPSTPIRHFARRAIDAIERRAAGGGRSGAPAQPPQRPEPSDWKAALAQPDPAKRLLVAQALRRADDPRARELAGERLISETDPNVQAALLGVLGRFRFDQDLDPICRFLAHPSPTVRGEAVMALEGYFNPAVPERLKPLLNDQDNRTRAAAILILGRYDEDLAIGPLTEMATADEVWMKDSAIFVARSLATPRTVELLGRMFRENRHDTYLRPKLEKATRDLAQRGDPTAERLVETVVCGRFDQHEDRLDLDRTLDAIEAELRDGGGNGSRARRVPKISLKTVDELLAFSGDDDFEKRLAAAEQAVDLDRSAALEMFRRRIEVETHPFVLSKLVKELGRVGGPDDIPAIEKALSSSDGRVRANAVEGLGLIGGDRVHEVARGLLEDPVPRVRANAARIVSRIDREKAFSTLKQMIVSEDQGVSESAIHALGEVWTDDVLELLEVGLTRKNQEVKIRIFKVLQKLSTKSRVASQIYNRYRQEGDGLLLNRGDVESMVDRMRDADPLARVRAVEALRRCTDARVVPALEKGAKDKDSRVRKASQVALNVRELEVERSALLYHAGSVVYRARRQTSVSAELEGALAQIESLSQELDKGGDLEEALSRRNDAVTQLGQRAFDLAREGRLDLAAIDGSLGEASARLAQIDKTVAERTRSLEEEFAVSGGRPPAGLEPVVPEVAAGPAAQVRSWLAQNRGAATALGVTITVLVLGFFASYLGRTGAKAGWTRDVPDVARLVAGERAVVALNTSGTATCLDADDGRVTWIYNRVTLENPFEPRLDKQHVYLSAPEGRIVAVVLSSGRKAWDVKTAGLACPPVVTDQALWALSPGPNPQLTLLEPGTGKTISNRGVESDARAIVGLENGAVLVRMKSVGMLRPKGDGSVWECALSSEIVLDPPPFDAGGQLVVRLKDKIIAVSAAGQTTWEKSLESGVAVVPPAAARKELALVGQKAVQFVHPDGRMGARVPITVEPAVTRGGRGDVAFSDPGGGVYSVSTRDKGERRFGNAKGKIVDLVKLGPLVYVAGEGRVEALSHGTR